ncbi:hypothetical protein [Haliangium sp.]|uniref:hypothetical protein n=1 Tax=Haliangium sp. TaxID=2663208 RepID=UPI003D0AE702
MLRAATAYQPTSPRTDDQPAAAPPSRLIELHLRITVLSSPDGEPVEGELVSIGPDEMFIRAKSLPILGSTAQLRFRMLSKRVCEADGTVVWQRDGGFGVGFDSRNEAMDHFLRELAKLTPNLRQIYLADVLYPRVDIEA